MALRSSHLSHPDVRRGGKVRVMRTNRLPTNSQQTLVQVLGGDSATAVEHSDSGQASRGSATSNNDLDLLVSRSHLQKYIRIHIGSFSLAHEG